MRVLFLVICLCQVLCFTSKNAVCMESACERWMAQQQRLAAMSPTTRTAYDEEQRELAKKQEMQAAAQRERDEEKHVLKYLGKAFENPEPGTAANRLRVLVLALVGSTKKIDAATSPLKILTGARFPSSSDDGITVPSSSCDRSPPLTARFLLDGSETPPPFKLSLVSKATGRNRWHSAEDLASLGTMIDPIGDSAETALGLAGSLEPKIMRRCMSYPPRRCPLDSAQLVPPITS